MIKTLIEKDSRGEKYFEIGKRLPVPNMGVIEIDSINVVKRFNMFYVSITGKGFEYLKPLTDKIEFVNAVR